MTELNRLTIAAASAGLAKRAFSARALKASIMSAGAATVPLREVKRLLMLNGAGNPNFRRSL